MRRHRLRRLRTFFPISQRARILRRQSVLPADGNSLCALSVTRPMPLLWHCGQCTVSPFALGCAFAEQREDAVRVGPNDVALDAVATEHGIIRREKN